MNNFKIYSEFNQELKDILSRIYNNQNNKIFQNYDWLLYENQIMNKNKILHLKLIVILENDIPLIFLPMCVKKINFAKVLTFLSSEVTDYNCPVCTKNLNININKFNQIWTELVNHIDYDVLFIDKIPEYLNDEKNPFFSNFFIAYQKTYLLNFKNFNFENFYLNKNNNKSIQTDRRKFKILRNSKLKITNQDLNLLQNHLIEKSKFYMKKGYKTFNPVLLNQFYLKILKTNNFDYLFSQMSCDNKVVSSIFGIIYGKIFYYLIPHVYESSLRKYSPGKYHLIELIKKYENSNISKIDFAPGDEDYKIKWSNQSYKIFYILKMKNYKSLIFYFKKKLYFILRKIRIIKKIKIYFNEIFYN